MQSENIFGLHILFRQQALCNATILIHGYFILPEYNLHKYPNIFMAICLHGDKIYVNLYYEF